jgi:hypothetical protein
MSDNIVIKWYGDKVLKDIEKLMPQALDDAAEFILDESNKRVPIDEGTLANSGNTFVDGDVAYVYYDTPYALRVHEDMSMKHKNGRTHHYLSYAVRDNKPKIQSIIAKRLRME